MPSAAALIMMHVVAALHLGFMVLETFLWTHPIGRRVFGMRADEAQATQVLAANQGIYNGALAGLLVWAAWSGSVGAMLAGLAFVVVVGVYGAATVSRLIFVVQALPALVAMGLLMSSS